MATKLKINRKEEHLLLEKIEQCTQILKDDRQKLRAQIKSGESELIELLRNYRKKSDLKDLQINLRHYLNYLKGRPTSALREVSSRNKSKANERGKSSFSKNQKAKESTPVNKHPEKSSSKKNLSSHRASKENKFINSFEGYETFSRKPKYNRIQDSRHEESEINLTSEKEICQTQEIDEIIYETVKKSSANNSPLAQMSERRSQEANPVSPYTNENENFNSIVQKSDEGSFSIIEQYRKYKQIHFPEELQSEEKFNSREFSHKSISNVKSESEQNPRETADFDFNIPNNRYQTRESVHNHALQSNDQYKVQKGSIGIPRESLDFQNLKEKAFGEIFAEERENSEFFSEQEDDFMKKMNTEQSNHQITLNENGEATFKMATQQSEQMTGFSPKPLISTGRAFRTEGTEDEGYTSDYIRSMMKVPSEFVHVDNKMESRNFAEDKEDKEVEKVKGKFASTNRYVVELFEDVKTKMEDDSALNKKKSEEPYIQFTKTERIDEENMEVCTFDEMREKLNFAIIPLENVISEFFLSGDMPKISKTFFSVKVKTIVKKYNLVGGANPKEIEALFNKFDLNKDNFIDIDDLGNSLVLFYNMKLNNDTLNEFFKRLDFYSSGQVREIDFIKFLDNNYRSELIDKVTKIYERNDKFNKGYFTFWEMLRISQKEPSFQPIFELWQKVRQTQH